MRISIPDSRPGRARAAGLLAGAAILGPLLAAPAAVAAPSPPPGSTPQVMAQAIIRPSIVYLSTTWKGWVRFANGNLLSNKAYQVTTSCSGFVANSTGYIVTAGHCVDNQTMEGGKGLIIETAIQAAVDDGRITAAEAKTTLPYGKANWKVEGADSGAPPDRTVSVYQTVAASGITQVQPMTASVVDFKSLAEGDAALLKVESPNPMPALEVAPQGAEDGVDVISAGYPGSVEGVTDFKLETSFKDGRISSQQTVNGVPFTEISAANSPGMSGGPTVDIQGRVLGTVSFKNSGESQAFNFITATSTVQALLSRNAVDNKLNATDQAYRAALSDYFTGRYREAVKQFDTVLQAEPNHQQAQLYRGKAAALQSTEPQRSSGVGPLVLGGAVLVLILVAVVALVLVLRRKHATAAASGPMPAPLAAGWQPTQPMPPASPGAPGPYWAPARAPIAPAPAPAPMIPAPPAPRAIVSAHPAPAPALPMPPAAAVPVSPAPASNVPMPASNVAMPPAPASNGAMPPAPASNVAMSPTPASGIVCASCGSPQQPGAAFCSACGHRLIASPVG
ncbi:MAG: hypothetical protein V7603_4912 [Micromonosporaceae bacterium]